VTTHLVIPDTQVKPGVPTDHLRWIGAYILDRRPDVVVHLGDHWDMPSLSSYDRGKMQMEGRRYDEDVASGNEALALITAPLERYNRGRRRRLQREYLPRLVLLRGNHEHRIARAVDDNAQLDGAIGFGDLESPGWEVYDFLEPVFIDGVGYAHFWANPLTGKPIGGMIETRLKTIGHSFTMGHVQTLQMGARYVHGPAGPRQQRGLIAGACYLHDEDYKGPQGNAHWRGVIVKHQVEDGAYDAMEVSLEYLCRRYEGVDLATFMATQHGIEVGA
jgi:hypothetical protein